MPDYRITLDGKDYILTGPIQDEVLDPGQFPTPVPETGIPLIGNLLIHKRVEKTPPWSIGLKDGYRADRIWDEENVNALFPGVLTLGPLKQSPTWTGGPATFKVRVGTGLKVTNDTIWMFGNGAAAADEPLWYLSGTTWTDATLNADIPSTVNDLAGIVQIENTYYAVHRSNVAVAGDNTVTFSSTNKTTWARLNTAPGNAENITWGVGGGSSPTVHFPTSYVRANATKLVCLGRGGQSTSDYEIVVLERSYTSLTATWAQVGSDSIRDTLNVPRGFVVWRDFAGAQDMFIGTDNGLWWFDVSAATISKVYTFRTTDSAYTGILARSPYDDKLYFVDGQNVGRLDWGSNGTLNIEYIGPQNFGKAPGGWNGLPTAKTGNVTGIAFSQTRPWLYVSVGGLAASRNAWVGVFNIEQGTWNCIYKGGTAQRALTTILEFNDQLHIMEEQAAGGDQDPFYFDTITTNPSVNTSYKYASTGAVTDSRFDGYVKSLRKGFFKFHAIGTGFSADENLSIKVASNDGSLGAAQTITSSPGAVWTDGTGAIGTDAMDLYAEITLNRGATNTNSPKAQAFGYSYQPKALKDDGTEVHRYTFQISRQQTDYMAITTKVEDILTNLQTSYRKRTLLTMTYKEGQNASVTLKGELLPFIVKRYPAPIGSSDAQTKFDPIDLTMMERI